MRRPPSKPTPIRPPRREPARRKWTRPEDFLPELRGGAPRPPRRPKRPPPNWSKLGAWLLVIALASATVLYSLN